MFNESEKEDLVLSYFSILSDLYDWNFQTYDIVIYDGTSNKGVKDMHDKILETLVLKEESNISSIIQSLSAKELLATLSGRYSSTGKTHWNDILEIPEELKENYKQLSAKLVYLLDLGISEVLKSDYNVVLLNLITNGVPLKNLNNLYPKEMNNLLITGLTDGQKIVGFNTSNYLYYKFNEHINSEKVNSLVKNEKLKLFSNFKDYEKAVISVLAREKVIIGKDIDYYSVTERTLDKWHRKLSEIVVNINDKVSECSKNTKLKPTQITQIIQHLKTKGHLWEYKNYTYNVVHEIVLGVIPYPPDDLSIGKVKDFDLELIPKVRLEETHDNLEPKQIPKQSKDIDQKLIFHIKKYVQGFCLNTKFTERPTQKKVEKYLSLLEIDLAKYGWSEEKEIFNVITNEFDLIIKAEKISNTKWRKLGKMFLKGLSTIPAIPM